jgi:kumamolisin
MPKWYDRPGTVHTHCLIWTGRAPHSGSDAEIQPNLFGPLQYMFPAGFHPADIRAAYDVDNLQGAQAIAILDAYSYPAALSDFNTFSSEFGLPQETSSNVFSSNNSVLQIVQPNGTPTTSDPDWDLEQATDIEWAHAMAPNAKIYLIECADDSENIFGQIGLAGLMAPMVSMSWGAQEGSWIYGSDGIFPFPNTPSVYFASTGDYAGDIEYPSTSQYVVGVGGTTLSEVHMVKTGTAVFAEAGWSDEGGGSSSYIGLPSYQDFLFFDYGIGSRTVPDVVAVADPSTGCSVYDSSYGGWLVMGGTSLSSPIVAGLFNDLGAYGQTSTAQLTQLYGWLGTATLRDIVLGGTSTGLRAGRGWDDMTGVGSLLASPVTLTMPSPGSLSASPGGTISYAFAASDPVHPSRTITSTVTGGPAWVTWNGTTLTASPPTGTRPGSYPVGLQASEPGYPSDIVNRTVLLTVANPILLSASLATTTEIGGATDQLTVKFSSPAPAAGISFKIVSNSAGVLVSSPVTIAQGNSSITVPVRTLAVQKSASATLTITYNVTKVILGLRILP